MAKRSAPPIPVRVLTPAEYPAAITAARGAYTPRIRFAAEHPAGLYYVEDQGAGYHMAYFQPRRRGSRAKIVGAGGNLAAALRRIQAHEDEMNEPNAPREEGKNGPVSIYSLGKRTSGAKTPTELDREIAAILAHED